MIHPDIVKLMSAYQDLQMAMLPIEGEPNLVDASKTFKDLAAETGLTREVLRPHLDAVRDEDVAVRRACLIKEVDEELIRTMYLNNAWSTSEGRSEY